MLSDQEVLDAVPIRQNSWSDNDMCIWMGRFIERLVLERMGANPDIQIIHWLPFVRTDKSTWPVKNIELALVDTGYRKVLARLTDDPIYGGEVFVGNENKYLKIEMTTVKRWARI